MSVITKLKLKIAEAHRDTSRSLEVSSGTLRDMTLPEPTADPAAIRHAAGLCLKRVDLGRALAMEPQVLLLDEPMAGMNVEEKQDMCRFVLDVNDEFGTTIVLIEHDMGVVMDISDRVVVLDYGKKIGDGVPEDVKNNEDVIKAYLGAGH